MITGLKDWCRQQIGLETRENLQFTPLSGDAGFRRYFRLHTTQPLLAVYAPVDTEDSEAFVRIAEVFLQQGIRAPVVHAHDFARGFLLIEDLGQQLLDTQIREADVDSIFSQTGRLLMLIQGCPQDPTIFPAYDANKLRSEMDLFTDWFVGQQLQLTLTRHEKQTVMDLFDALVENAEEQPRVVVHRDYHSKNLVYAEDGNYGVIDFQDAVVGPMTYDLTSILRDRYHNWPEERVEAWALAYAKQATDKGIIPALRPEQFLRWFDLMGLQRQIKVLGIFCRLALRDGKVEYLSLLPVAVSHTRRILAKYPALSLFAEWFERRLIPLIDAQAWMSLKKGDRVSE